MSEWIILAVMAGLIFIPLALGSLISHIKDIAPSTQRKNRELEEKTKEYEKAKLDLENEYQSKIKEYENKQILLERKNNETAAKLVEEDTRISDRLRKLLRFEKELKEKEASAKTICEQGKKTLYLVEKANQNITAALYQTFDRSTVDSLCGVSDGDKLLRGLDGNFDILHSELRFIIKSENDTYETSLSSCTCKSFKFGHGEPCKHMIWIGSRLGIFILRERGLAIRESALSDKENAVKTEFSFIEQKKINLSSREEDLRRKEQSFQKEVLKKERFFQEEREEIENIRSVCFDQSQNYPWLADFVYRLNEETDNHRFHRLRELRASKSAEIVKAIRKEKNAAIHELNLLKSQLAVYESLFPWLEEFKALPVDEAAKYALASASNEDYTAALRKWLSPEEYAKLSPAEKSQLALERYMKREKTDWEVGVEYERYIGYLYELDGYSVKYTGATQGLTDMGRDLVAEKDGIVRIIQCKRWSSDKTIHEKHIFQLFGTTFVMRVSDSTKEYKGIFYTSTNLSPLAAECASQLGIEVHQSCKMEDYPVIKCNIGHDEYGNPEKIYHLPFDQQYDRVVIEPSKGEFYAHTVQEAENAGFRHAYKWMGA